MSQAITIAELFAGVGGFRLGLEGYHDPEHPEFDMPAAGNFKTVWANQWEPGSDRRQFAARCYMERFGWDSLVNQDIHQTLDEYEAGERDIPDVEMVVGGFPCQDYSVARPLSQSDGIEGKKGVLWWDIYRFLTLKRPRFALFENVDRLLKSPAKQRGRDFAIILSCLASLGYTAEWRVINSAEYGCPQRRKRVYIFCELRKGECDLHAMLWHGVLAEAFPVYEAEHVESFDLLSTPLENSEGFGAGSKISPFLSAGSMQDGHVLTADARAHWDGPFAALGDVLESEHRVPDEYYVDEHRLGQWEYLKGAKREKRVDKRTGYEYYYSEGAMAFPDPLDRPSRTILTGEGGVSPSRFKHVIERSGRLRRLVPEELEALQGFPKGWTDTGMTDGNRAFCMGNALVVDVPHRIGKALWRRIECGEC